MKHDCYGKNKDFKEVIVGPTDNGAGPKDPCPPCAEAEEQAKERLIKEAAKKKSAPNKPNTLCPRATSKPSDGLSANKGGDSVDASNCKDILQIIVTLAGTTDPVNAHNAKGSRAISYSTTISGREIRYWDRCFVNDLKKLEEENKNIIVFPFHGWTGDNRIKNREIAGAYLIDRLCGEGSQENNAYYAGYKKRDVHFHFIGHSHGGNVINEMTKQIAKLGSKWPEKWKVKSLVYLSTPFFNEIHQAKKSGAFHGGIQIFNAYNEYDMTQRLLADFSMEPLTGVLDGLDLCQLNCYLAKIKSFKFPKIGTPSLEDKNDDWFGFDVQLTIPNAQGEKVYDGFIELFENVKGLMDSILIIIRSLDGDFTFDVGKDIKNALGEDALSYERVMMPPKKGIPQRFDGIIADINRELLSTIKNLETRKNHYSQSNETYPVSGLISDIRVKGIVTTLIAFLDIDSKTLASTSSDGLWRLIYEIIDYNIEDFDDTYTDPTKQLSGIPIVSLNVTQRDMYHGSKGSANYQNFVNYIEGVEAKYDNNPSEKNLLDILFTLIQQMGVMYDYKGVGFGDALKAFANLWKANRWSHLDFDPSEFEKQLFKLASMVQNYQNIFKARDFGDITDERDFIEDTNIKEDMLDIRGGIPYLFVHSHSTSRRCIHKEMVQFMKKQTSC